MQKKAEKILQKLRIVERDMEIFKNNNSAQLVKRLAVDTK